MRQDLTKQVVSIIGTNHKTSDVSVRERLAMPNCSKPPLQVFNGLNVCSELIFLSTCNRVEVIAASSCGEEAIAAIQQKWQELSGLDANTVLQNTFRHHGADAVRHLFEVAASLDSMIVGEPQILGQLKNAHKAACEANTCSTILNRLMEHAFFVAKAIRTQTKIGSSAVSISYAAVELARKIFGELTGKTALLIGAGEMAEIAAQHLKQQGVKSIIVANRTLERGIELAQRLGGEAISLSELTDALIKADIVISSTGAPGYVLLKEQVEKVMRPRRHRLLFLIDIAVPRDIDPAINEVDNVYLYDIDDLKGVVDQNKAEREKEAVKAHRLIDTEVIKFFAWQKTLGVVPIIHELQSKAEEIRIKELSRAKAAMKNLTPEHEAVLEAMSKSIAQKMIQSPIICLKKESEENPEIMSACSKLFALNHAVEQ